MIKQQKIRLGTKSNKSVDLIKHLGKKSLISLALSFKLNHRYNKENTICVFAQPRGGSTWFSNLFLALANTAKIDEPLHRGLFFPNGELPLKGSGKLDILDELNFYWHQPIPEDQEYAEAARFFDRLFRLKYTSPYLFEETPLWNLFMANTFVFKFCEANLLLKWLVRRFELSPIVLMRSPFAVVASQLDFFAFRKIMNCNAYLLPNFPFKEYFDPYLEILDGLSYPEELLAARWCLNHLPVKDNDERWLTVYYEKMVRQPEIELPRVFAYLKRPIPENVYAYFEMPSFRNHQTKTYYKNVDLHLDNWKKRLGLEQVKRIISVCDRFGINSYDNEPIVGVL